MPSKNKIYTRHGDAGKTTLASGEKVFKHDLRIAVSGDIDELNSSLGIILSFLSVYQQEFHDLTSLIETKLKRIQHELFDLGSQISKCSFYVVDFEKAVIRLEKEIDEMDQKLPEIRQFILPGGHPLSAFFHQSRTICRKAERSACVLLEEGNHDLPFIKYLNRLSDYLFTFARWTNIHFGVNEPFWEKQIVDEKTDGDTTKN